MMTMTTMLGTMRYHQGTLSDDGPLWVRKMFGNVHATMMMMTMMRWSPYHRHQRSYYADPRRSVRADQEVG